MFEKIFKRKRPPKLYFALAVSDRPTDGFKFTPDKNCKVFLVAGEVEKRVVIPQTVLKEVVERFMKAPAKEEGDVIKISEKNV